MALDLIFDYRPFQDSIFIYLRGKDEYDYKFNLNKYDSPKNKFETLDMAINTALGTISKDKNYRKRKLNFKIYKNDGFEETLLGYTRADYRNLIHNSMKKYSLKGKIMPMDKSS